MVKIKNPFVRYILRRFANVVPLILIAITLNFVLIRLAPGDPVYYYVSVEGVSPEFLEMMRERLGLSAPLHIQYLNYLTRLARLDFGDSFLYRIPVMSLIIQRLPVTLMLMVTQLVVAVVVGVILGTVSAQRVNSRVDFLIQFLSLVLLSMPIFWLGTILLLVFALYLGWLPAFGISSPIVPTDPLAAFVDILKHSILPVATLTSATIPIITRLTRSSMIEVSSRGFVTTARSKGVKERTVFFRHVLRNALLPVVTMIGYQAGYLLAGATLTETIFAWPGLGRLTYEAVIALDYPVLMGMFIIVSVSVIIANFFTDVIYGILDPRIRYE